MICRIGFVIIYHTNSNSIFGSGKKPFIYQEVIDLGGEPIKNTDYTHLGRVTEFKYGQKLSEVSSI